MVSSSADYADNWVSTGAIATGCLDIVSIVSRCDHVAIALVTDSGNLRNLRIRIV